MATVSDFSALQEVATTEEEEEEVGLTLEINPNCSAKKLQNFSFFSLSRIISIIIS